ncbi:MAG: regulator of sigma D [Limisphaerales bacterium]
MSSILKIKKCLDARHNDLLEALTKRFSENTIDYISYGHFRLFQDHRLEPHQVAALDSITQQVLQFDNR